MYFPEKNVPDAKIFFSLTGANTRNEDRATRDLLSRYCTNLYNIVLFAYFSLSSRWLPFSFLTLFFRTFVFSGIELGSRACSVAKEPKCAY